MDAAVEGLFVAYATADSLATVSHHTRRLFMSVHAFHSFLMDVRLPSVTFERALAVYRHVVTGARLEVKGGVVVTASTTTTDAASQGRVLQVMNLALFRASLSILAPLAFPGLAAKAPSTTATPSISIDRRRRADAVLSKFVQDRVLPLAACHGIEVGGGSDVLWATKLMRRYRTGLRRLFDHYCTSSLSTGMHLGPSTRHRSTRGPPLPNRRGGKDVMTFHQFTRFATDFDVFPSMLTRTQLVAIARISSTESSVLYHTSDTSAALALTFDEFVVCVGRCGVMAPPGLPIADLDPRGRVHRFLKVVRRKYKDMFGLPLLVTHTPTPSQTVTQSVGVGAVDGLFPERSRRLTVINIKPTPNSAVPIRPLVSGVGAQEKEEEEEVEVEVEMKGAVVEEVEEEEEEEEEVDEEELDAEYDDDEFVASDLDSYSQEDEASSERQDSVVLGAAEEKESPVPTSVPLPLPTLPIPPSVPTTSPPVAAPPPIPRSTALTAFMDDVDAHIAQMYAFLSSQDSGTTSNIFDASTVSSAGSLDHSQQPTCSVQPVPFPAPTPRPPPVPISGPGFVGPPFTPVVDVVSPPRPACSVPHPSVPFPPPKSPGTARLLSRRSSMGATTNVGNSHAVRVLGTRVTDVGRAVILELPLNDIVPPQPSTQPAHVRHDHYHHVHTRSLGPGVPPYL